MDNLVYITHIGPLGFKNISAYSSAGALVNFEIINQLKKKAGELNISVISMQPVPIWPKGPLFVNGMKENNIYFPSFINLYILKHLFFAIQVFFFIRKKNPKICFQYNSYFFENVILLIFKKSKLVNKVSIILQDINISAKFNTLDYLNINKLLELIGLRILRSFDLILPISNEIISDFKFSPSKCMVFQGASTKYANENLHKYTKSKENIVVFAGALEYYNGIDILLQKWKTENIKIELHIYGKGNLTKLTESCQCEYIIYHGFQGEEVINKMMERARWVINLRYSKGINEKYFFPSKFFNLVCTDCVVLTNSFFALPKILKPYLCILEEDLSNLTELINSSNSINIFEIVKDRRKVVQDNFSWEKCINDMLIWLKVNYD